MGVVREAVTEMRRTAAAARPSLDPALLAAFTERADSAVADLRRLIGLLRREPDTRPVPSPSPQRRSWMVDVLTALAACAVTVAEVDLLPGVEPDCVAVVVAAILPGALAVRRTNLTVAVLVAIGVQGVGAEVLPGLGAALV